MEDIWWTQQRLSSAYIPVSSTSQMYLCVSITSADLKIRRLKQHSPLKRRKRDSNERKNIAFVHATRATAKRNPGEEEQQQHRLCFHWADLLAEHFF